MRDLIAISGKQFSGKDQLADYLLAELPAFQKRSLARAIKLEFGATHRLTLEEIEANKSLYRPGLIELGQRRRAEDPDYWLKQVLQDPVPKIIPDLRMKREYELFRAHHAFCIRVETDRDIRAERGRLVQEADPTECDLDDVMDWDMVVTNNGSLEELKATARKITDRIKNEP